MVKIDVKGCNSFVKESEYQTYVEKALAAYDVLDAETGAGNDFLGWKTLPVDIPESLICEFESIRDDWKNKGVNLVIVIGIGGSYLGARCAIEDISSFARRAFLRSYLQETIFPRSILLNLWILQRQAIPLS